MGPAANCQLLGANRAMRSFRSSRDEPNELQSRSLVKRRHRLSEHFPSYLLALVFQGLIEHPAPQRKPIAARAIVGNRRSPLSSVTSLSPARAFMSLKRPAESHQQQYGGRATE